MSAQIRFSLKPIVLLSILALVSRGSDLVNLAMVNDFLRYAIREASADVSESDSWCLSGQLSVQEKTRFEKRAAYFLQQSAIPGITSRSAVSLAQAMHWIGEDVTALHYLRQATLAAPRDPIAWQAEREITEDQDPRLPDWWHWGKAFFMQEADCWLQADEPDKAANSLSLFIQSALQDQQYDVIDIEQARAVFVTVRRLCESELELCAFPMESLEWRLWQLFEAASQSVLPLIRAEGYFSIAQMQSAHSMAAETVLRGYEQAVLNNPRSIRYRVHLANMLAVMNRYEEAESHLQTALANSEGDPDRALVLGEMGHLYFAQHVDVEAVVYFQDSLAIERTNNSYRIGLARSYLRLGRIPEAIDLLLEALQTESSSAIIWGYLGIAYIDATQLDAGAEALTMSIKLDPNNIPLRLELAQVLVRLGNHEEAVKHYEAILAQDPSRLDVKECVDQLQR